MNVEKAKSWASLLYKNDATTPKKSPSPATPINHSQTVETFFSDLRKKPVKKIDRRKEHHNRNLSVGFQGFFAPQYKNFSDFVLHVKKNMPKSVVWDFKLLGNVSNDLNERGQNIFYFDESRETIFCAKIFFELFYAQPDIAKYYQDRPDDPPCILFTLASVADHLRCYVTVSGHVNFAKIVIDRRQYLDDCCKALNTNPAFKEKLTLGLGREVIFVFGDNNNIYNAAQIMYQFDERPAVDDLNQNKFTRPCAEKSKLILLLKKYYQYGLQFQVQGVVACNLFPEYSEEDPCLSKLDGTDFWLAYPSERTSSGWSSNKYILINKEKGLYVSTKPPCSDCSELRLATLSLYRIAQLVGEVSLQVMLSASPDANRDNIIDFKINRHTIRDDKFLGMLVGMMPDLAKREIFQSCLTTDILSDDDCSVDLASEYPSRTFSVG